MDKLLIIDGNSIANRAFYALPFLSDHLGNPTGAVFGFANIIIKIINETKPTHIVVAFDHARKTFRNQIYKDYKMQRKPTPEELIKQFPVIKDMLNTMKIQIIEQEGIEADDIIGTISRLYSGEKFILSGDRDLLQLIDDTTTVWLTKKGVTEVDKVDSLRLLEIFNLAPNQIIDLKALMGDASDNIPGVSGVGEKTALNLLEKYKSLDNVYQHIDEITGKLKDKLILDKDNAFMSKQLATIKTDCKIEFNKDDAILIYPFGQEVYEFFKEKDFSSLLKNNSLYNQSQTIKKEKSEKVIFSKDNLKELSNIEEGIISINLNNMEILFNNKLYYLERNYGMFEDNNLSTKNILHELKNVFEDEQILKITNDAKRDIHILSNFGIDLKNYFDLSIANYVINAGLKTKNEFNNIDEFKDLYQNFKQGIIENKLDFVFYQIELPLVKILANMEDNGFKINFDKLNILNEEFSEKIDSLKKEIYLQSGEEFNINSPKQVAYVLFEKLGIKTYNNKKQSTSAIKLDEYRYIPIVDNILTYRKYSKIKNTYIDVYSNICKTQGDIIHTTFNQTLTSTGRLSSSEPNLQNIPTRDDEGKNLRKIFVSKFKNGKIISADYNQIELRLLASFSNESDLVKAYNNGADIHKLTASQIFNTPIELVSDNQRREAKAVNFGIIYGISDYGLSQNIKTTKAQAKKYIDSYFEKYSKVKEFMEENINFAKLNGFAVTKFGRIRKIPELSSSTYFTRMFGERVAMNMPLQGTASDIIKLAMIKVSEALKDNNLKSELILQIHDELIIDCVDDEIDTVKKILKSSMENVTNLNVPLVVNIGVGESLFDCK